MMKTMMFLTDKSDAIYDEGNHEEVMVTTVVDDPLALEEEGH